MNSQNISKNRRHKGQMILVFLILLVAMLACNLQKKFETDVNAEYSWDDFQTDDSLGLDEEDFEYSDDSDLFYEDDDEELGAISDETGSDPVGTGNEDALNANGPLKPVGFINYGQHDAVVRPWTYIPLGESVQKSPVSASTVSSANDGIGDWPNSSRFLSLPMGIYTWCVDWEEGDIDEDGKIDYSHYFIDEPTTLDENDSDELEFAEEVSISAPPTTAPIYPDRCEDPPRSRCSGQIEVSAQVLWASTMDDPPDYSAYANPAVIASPPGVSVSFGGSTSGFDSAVILNEPGAWIQASTSNQLYGMGVQIMGDQNIGWARVLFDGAEIWRGDTAHTWNDGTNYGEYVEVRCFPPGTHTLTVENLGIEGQYGGISVPISWFAFRR